MSLPQRILLLIILSLSPSVALGFTLGNFCPPQDPGTCFENVDQTSCEGSTLGCTWDATFTVYDEACCVPGGPAPAPEIPPSLWMWVVLGLVAMVVILSSMTRLSDTKPDGRR